MFRFASDVTCLSSFTLPGRDIQLAAGSGDFKIKYHRPDYDQPITIVGHEVLVCILSFLWGSITTGKTDKYRGGPP